MSGNPLKASEAVEKVSWDKYVSEGKRAHKYVSKKKKKEDKYSSPFTQKGMSFKTDQFPMKKLTSPSPAKKPIGALDVISTDSLMNTSSILGRSGLESSPDPKASSTTVDKKHVNWDAVMGGGSKKDAVTSGSNTPLPAKKSPLMGDDDWILLDDWSSKTGGSKAPTKKKSPLKAPLVTAAIITGVATLIGTGISAYGKSRAERRAEEKERELERRRKLERSQDQMMEVVSSQADRHLSAAVSGGGWYVG